MIEPGMKISGSVHPVDKLTKLITLPERKTKGITITGDYIQSFCRKETLIEIDDFQYVIKQNLKVELIRLIHQGLEI